MSETPAPMVDRRTGAQAWCRYRFVPAPVAESNARRGRALEYALAWAEAHGIEVHHHPQSDGFDLRFAWSASVTISMLAELFGSGAVPGELILLDVRRDDSVLSELGSLALEHGVHVELM